MVTKYGVYVPVTREQLLAAGAVEPTQEEKTQMERDYAEHQEREARYADALTDFRSALAAVTDPVARAVLDLHTAEIELQQLKCAGDDMDGYDCETPGWPCTTVGTVATALGIPVPDRWA